MKMEYNEAAFVFSSFYVVCDISHICVASTSVVSLMLYVFHIHISVKTSNLFALSMGLRQNICVGEYKMLLNHGKGDQIHENKDKNKKNTIGKTALRTKIHDKTTIISAHSKNSLSTTSNPNDSASGGSIEAVSNLRSTISDQDGSTINLTLTHPTSSKQLNLVCNREYLDDLSSNNVHREAERTAIINFYGNHADLSIVTCCIHGELVTGYESGDHDFAPVKAIDDIRLLNGTLNGHRYLTRKQSSHYNIACSLSSQSPTSGSCSTIYNIALSNSSIKVTSKMNSTLNTKSVNCFLFRFLLFLMCVLSFLSWSKKWFDRKTKEERVVTR